LSPEDYSVKVHLEITMLLALGILDEKPAWVDVNPVIRPDGTAWSRHWWPRPMEHRELLPAAKLPHDILARILPPDGPDCDVGDLADALYERANHYADEECVECARQAAIAQRDSAEAVYLNAIRRARQREMLAAVGRSNVQPVAPGGCPHHPAAFPAAPTMPLPLGRPPLHPPHGHFGGPHGNMGMPNPHGGMSVPGAFAPHGVVADKPPRPGLPDAQSDARFAMKHGIWPTPQVGSLFESMGTPKELTYQQAVSSIPSPQGDDRCSTTALPE